MNLTGLIAPLQYENRKTSLDEHGHLDFSPHDPENPKNYSLARKYWITTIAITLVANATFSSSSPTGSLNGISGDLHVSKEAAGLVTTLFLLGYVAGPLFWAPLVSRHRSKQPLRYEYLQACSPSSTVVGGSFTSLSCFTLHLGFSAPSHPTSPDSWSAAS